MVLFEHNSYVVRVVRRVAALLSVLAFTACTDADVKVSMLSSTTRGAVQVSLSSSVGEQTNQTSIPVTVKFSESVDGVRAEDFEVTNGTILSFSGSGDSYTLTIAPSGDGEIKIGFKADTVSVKKTAAGGERSFQKSASGNSLKLKSDQVPPAMQMMPAGGSTSTSSTIVFNISFSEDVIGLSASDFIVTGGSVASLSGSGSSYQLNVLASTAGTITVENGEGCATDKAGNPIPAFSSQVQFSPAAPIATLSSAVGSLTNLSQIPFTIDFGGVNVTDLTVSDFTASNATIISLAGSGSTYTAIAVPKSDGVFTIHLPASTVVSGFGVANVASNVVTFDVDRVPPSLVASAPSPAMGNSATKFAWVVSYSGASLVTLNSANVILSGVTTGCSSGVTALNSTQYEVALTGCSSTGQVNVSIAAQTATDLAGNLATGITLNPVTVDNNTYIASMEKASDSVYETSATATQNFNITLNIPAVTDVTVNYSLVGTFTSAVNPTNYNLAGGSIVIPAGQQSGTVNYQYVGDTTSGGSKTIQVSLSGGASLAGKSISIGRQIFRRLVVDEETQPYYFTRVIVSNYHACAARYSNSIQCWGTNSSGLFGNGNTTNSYKPIDAGFSTGFIKMSSSNAHMCGITTANVLKCWGVNSNSELGDSTTVSRTLPTAIDSGELYADVSAGKNHTCAVTTSGVLKCWGLNTSGQVGDGTAVTRSAPVVIDSGVIYKTVAAGSTHTCAITDSGLVKCWGANLYGELGNGSTVSSLLPSIVDSSTVYDQISLGTNHSCAIVTSTGALKCWGMNVSYGALGDGTTVNKTVPTLIDSGVPYSKISLGGNHSCGLVSGGLIKCWGEGNSGQLGLGPSIGTVTVPTVVDGTALYIDIASSTNATCGVKNDHSISCWGYNAVGNIGDGQRSSFSTAIDLLDDSSYSMIGPGPIHTCGVTDSGVLKCWGTNGSWQMGDGTQVSKSSPVVIDPANTYSTVSSGTLGTCAISTSGKLSCWGVNIYGEVGNGTLVKQISPAQIDSGSLYTSVSSGSGHNCGITTANVLKCWGYNSNGQLGDGSTTNRTSPVVIDSGVQYSVVSAGSKHTCAITTAGVLKCWGGNTSGQIGNGTTVSVLSPVEIDSSIQYSQVAVGSDHSCALTNTGVVKCWGANTVGQLADGTSVAKSTPVIVDAGVTYTKIRTGTMQSCGMISGGYIKCWGYNGWGELGSISANARAATLVSEFGSVIDFYLKDSQTFLRASNGKIKVLGLDHYGQLGVGRQIFWPSPVAFD